MTGLCECGCGQPTRIAPRTRAALGWVQGQPIRFISGHNGRSTHLEYVEEDQGHSTPCWIWQRHINRDGYGCAYRGRVFIGAHRLFYERERGPVPADLQLDHLCHTADETCAGGPACPHRRCVNPDHLEPVTPLVNARRSTKTKLTDEQVREIVASPLPQRAIARRFGVSQATVWRYKSVDALERAA